MNNFGKYKPPLFINIILILVRVGLGRGKLKNLFSRIIKKYNYLKYLDLIYKGLKIRLSPFGNTIESKILLSSKTREKLNFMK